MEETNKVQRKLPSQEIDYVKILKILLSRWYWIVSCVAITMIVAYIYLWYTPKTYETGGTLKIEEKKTQIADITGTVAVPDRSPSQIQSIISVLKSRSLIVSAIKDLDYRISFYISGRVRISEIYPQKPLNIDLIKFDTLNFYRGILNFKPLNRESYYMISQAGGKNVTQVCRYNSPVSFGPTTFSIAYPGPINSKASYLFKFNIPDDFVGRVRGGMQANETAKFSNIIAIEQVDQNPQFAADILNSVMNEYVKFDKQQKAQSATQTISFIVDRQDVLHDSVKNSGDKIEKYQQKNKIIDANSAATVLQTKVTELQNTLQELKTEMIPLDDVIFKVREEKNDAKANFDVSESDNPGLGAAISKLDELITERNSLLKTFIPSSQLVQDANKQILQIKATVLNSLQSLREQNLKKQAFLNVKLSVLNQDISKVPGAQRDMTSLQGDFDVHNKVYSFLSEKRLDAEINKAGILPGATIIENAQPNFGAVSPDEHGIYHTAFILGLAIGLGSIVLIRILNPYIYDKETIESLTFIPILGVVRKFPEPIDENSTQILAISKPRSVFAESVRSVRTNLSFLASGEASKVICITSEVAGEGKSFIAINLSSTMSLIEKKVILVAADLRRSKIHRTFNVPNTVGLSSYLSHQAGLEDIILKSNQANLDIIVSGPVPPNPSELLHTETMKKLVDELKTRYDFVMIDTAPVGLVSDAIPLIRLSNINVFVIRSGKSKFYAASVPQRIATEYNLHNTVIILNAYQEDLLHSRHYSTKFTADNLGSGHYYYTDYSNYNGSGYYTDFEGDNWWQKIRRLFKNKDQ